MRRRNAATVATSPEIPQKAVKENIDLLLQVDPVAVEVGMGLVRLVEGGQNSPLLQRIAGIRKNLASQFGYVLPPVKVNDNIALRSREYTVLLKGVEIARYELPAGQELAIPTGRNNQPLEGKPTKDPAFGLPAVWIPVERAEQARLAGYTVVDEISVMGTHLSETIRKYAHELFTRQDAKAFCDRVGLNNPKLIEDLVPKMLSLSLIQRVLQNLLRERVPIRDAVTILEALGEGSQMTKNPILLTEFVRQAIRRTLVKAHVNPQGELAAYMLDSGTEQMIEGVIEHGEHNSVLGLAPQAMRDVVNKISGKFDAANPSVVLTNSAVRYFVRQILEPVAPQVTVLSHNEVPPETKVKPLGLAA
jgi:flagellar biosynthesis protein FlhA